MQKSPNINYLWSSLIVEELIRNGIEQFFIAPGSRSSPLSMAVAENPKAKSVVHFDERGLAFQALGYTAGSKKPCVLICTSGTAAANFFPAIIEASKKKLPLIIITADRPPELRFTGANQTIDQVKIFGDYVRFFFDLPCPTIDISAETILTTIDQLVSKAKGELKGPVHLNCMFREPLAPVKSKENLNAYLKNLSAWLKSNRPLTHYTLPEKNISAKDSQSLAVQICAIKNGLIVVGKLASIEEQEKVLELADKLEWPIFSDVTSGLRLNSEHPNVIHYYDLILNNEKLSKKLNFDGVIHLGGRMTSKRYYQFIEDLKPQNYLMVLNHPLRNDPTHQVTERIQTSVSHFVDQMLPKLSHRKPNPTLKFLRQANRQTEITLTKHFETDESLNEPLAAWTLSQLVPNNHILFLANSLPIREMDMFGRPHGSNLEVAANRGASGIDGLIATSVGYSLGSHKPVTLLIGDLAFLHDLNSLSLIKYAPKPITIVVINNDGGGIFNFLPVAQNNAHFEKIFGTPHELTFKSAAELFGLSYSKVQSIENFVNVYTKKGTGYNSSLSPFSQSQIIEITTDRKDNVNLHQKIKQKLIAAIK